MVRKAEAKIIIPFNSLTTLRAIGKAISVDERIQPNPKASIKAKVEKRTLNIIIKADGVPSLRAAFNSNLRLILSCIRVIENLNSLR
ncbi:CTAG/PCC1 family protein [Candidatus Bathyarchaeota archaeon]|nr:CTAG/PCC1 family protein [Candidatus Bathyarchaeota archaeon]